MWFRKSRLSRSKIITERVIESPQLEVLPSPQPLQVYTLQELPDPKAEFIFRFVSTGGVQSTIPPFTIHSFTSVGSTSLILTDVREEV
jgi:hypothetical protein